MQVVESVSLTVPSRPAIILCVRGYPRVFQLGVDGEVTFASPFRTAATPRGFVLCNSAGDMQVCQVTQYMKYDCPWYVVILVASYWA